MKKIINLSSELNEEPQQKPKDEYEILRNVEFNKNQMCQAILLLLSNQRMLTESEIADIKNNII